MSERNPGLGVNSVLNFRPALPLVTTMTQTLAEHRFPYRFSK